MHTRYITVGCTAIYAYSDLSLVCEGGTGEKEGRGRAE